MINERPEAFALARYAMCCAGFVVIGTPQNAFALDADPPPAKPKPALQQPVKELNGATLRPVAIRLEGTLSLLSDYSVGITAGYAFHRMFALEGTAAWEGGFQHGIMGRLRVPLTPSSSISVGAGATILWIPWQDAHNPPGVYLWVPAEIGYEYREKEGFTFLIGVGPRFLVAAEHAYRAFCIACLTDPPRVYPAGRFGIGWAF